jgi:hypothetical protein
MVKVCCGQMAGIPMPLKFERGASVVLLGEDLQFSGEDGTRRIKFILSDEAMRAYARTGKKLTQQEKFKVYDRHRAEIQNTALRLYTAQSTKNQFVIRFQDL